MHNNPTTNLSSIKWAFIYLKDIRENIEMILNSNKYSETVDQSKFQMAKVNIEKQKIMGQEIDEYQFKKHTG